MFLKFSSDREFPLRLTSYDYDIISKQVAKHLESRLTKVDRQFIEGIIYRQVVIEIEKLRAELILMIQEEFKILKKKVV